MICSEWSREMSHHRRTVRANEISIFGPFSISAIICCSYVRDFVVVERWKSIFAYRLILSWGFSVYNSAKFEHFPCRPPTAVAAASRWGWDEHNKLQNNRNRPFHLSLEPKRVVNFRRLKSSHYIAATWYSRSRLTRPIRPESSAGWLLLSVVWGFMRKSQKNPLLGQLSFSIIIHFSYLIQMKICVSSCQMCALLSARGPAEVNKI